MADIFYAFTVDQTARVTGLSRQKLHSWRRTGFFVPSVAGDATGHDAEWLYSFEDLRNLRVLSELRERCSLQHLRLVKQALAELGHVQWHRLHLYVLKNRVVIGREGDLADVLSGQVAMDLPLELVAGTVESQIRALSERRSDEIGHISKRRGVLRSAEVVSGTRIPVRAIQRFAAEGFTVAQIMLEYPQLAEADVLAALKARKVA